MTPEIDVLIQERSTINTKLEEAILASSLSRREQLALITEHVLWPISPFIEHPFLEKEKELQERVKSATGKDWCITDDVFHGESGYERHQDIYYSDVIDRYEDEDDEDKIILVTTRTNDMTIEVTFQEFTELLLDFAFETKQIGFNFDW